MCLILLAYHTHAAYPVIIAANRDEFFARPTAPCAFWADSPHILAGKDLLAGGTWLGITRQGKLAALTNYRQFPAPTSGQRSRGELPLNFLNNVQSAPEYLQECIAHADSYQGFNLIVGNIQQLYYYSNRANSAPIALTSGIYGVSNHLLNTPWDKLNRAKSAFTQTLTQEFDVDQYFSLLHDMQKTEDAALPDTGIGYTWEKLLSSIFIQSADYGTRCSTVLRMANNGHVELWERSFQNTGTVETHFYQFQFDKKS